MGRLRAASLWPHSWGTSLRPTGPVGTPIGTIQVERGAGVVRFSTETVRRIVIFRSHAGRNSDHANHTIHHTPDACGASGSADYDPDSPRNGETRGSWSNCTSRACCAAAAY